MHTTRRLFLILLVISFVVLDLKAQDPIIHVSNAPNLQIYPDMDGDYIVWKDNRDGSQHIYLYYIPDSTETKITTLASTKSAPKISGNRVVWADNRNGKWDIYNYRIDLPQLQDYPLIDYSGDQDQPDLDGDRLVYIDHSAGSFSSNLYLYDIGTGNFPLQITDDNMGPQYHPSIEGDLIAFATYEDIWMYNIYTDEILVVCDHSADQRNPVISGRRIFWEDDRNGNTDIYMFYYYYYALSNLVHLEDWPLSVIWERNQPMPSNQTQPHIWEDKLVFSDDLSGNNDIYLYDFNNKLWGSMTQLSGAAEDEFGAVACGDRVVWYDDENPSPWIISQSDVFMWERPEGADLSVYLSVEPAEIQVGEFMTYTILATNYGPMNATGVMVSDTLSNKVNFMSCNSSGGNCSQLGNIVTCAIGDLASDSTVVITIVAQAAEEGFIINRAGITGNEIDRVESNNVLQVKNRAKIFKSKMIDAGYSPKIAVDQMGNAHVCYLSSEYDANLLYATNQAGYWENQTLVSTNDVYCPNIALDMNGKVHICYAQGDGWANSLKYINNTAGFFSSPETLIPNAEECIFTNIKVDHSNFVHITCQTTAWSGSVAKYLNNSSGSWTIDDIFNSAYNSSSMDIDEDGYVHFASYSVLYGGPFYMTNKFNGVWSSPEPIEPNWIGGQMESLVIDINVDGLNVPHISYVGSVNDDYEENYKYATKIGGVWVFEEVDDGDFAGGFHAISVAPDYTPEITYHQRSSNEIRFASKQSGNFDQYYIDNSFWDWWKATNDIAVDSSNFLHICYVARGKVYYVTNAVYSSHYGGGDEGTGGYYFANSSPAGSSAPSQPTYEWIDPVASGHTEIQTWTSGTSDDGYYGPVPLNFTFLFFDSTYNEIYINSNGYISFENGYDQTLENSYIPYVEEPNDYMAICAMDLSMENTDSHVYFGESNSNFVVTYLRAYDKGSISDYITFQAIIYQNGNIKFQYNNLESSDPLPNSIGEDALVGIENYFGTRGVQYRNNGSGGPLFGSPMAVMFGKNQNEIPVEFVSFSAICTDNRVDLEWITATETNSDYFEVHRRHIVDTGEWFNLGRIKSAGNSTEPIKYHFADTGLKQGAYIYRIKSVDFDGSFSFSEELEVNMSLPVEYSLSQNYPNPFNPITKIKYTLPSVSDVKLAVFDILGRRVTTLINHRQDPGYYEIEFNAGNLASGVYFYRIEANDFIVTKKMMILK